MGDNSGIDMFERKHMPRYLKFTIISFLFLLGYIVMKLDSRASEIRIRQHFDWRFDSLAVFYRQIPATLYDGNGKCVLVYPDSILYKKVDGYIGVRKRQ